MLTKERLTIFLPLCGFVMLFAALQASPVSAGYKVAALKAVQGDVLVQKHSTAVWVSAKNNMPLYAQDTVMTKKNGEAQIVFIEGHSIKLRSFTTIQLKAPRPPTKKESAGSKPTSDVKCTAGRVFAKIKKSLNAEAKFEVATPSSIVGVRGTAFSLQVKEGGDTLCSVSEGSVEIHNDLENVLVHEGEQIAVDYETGDMPDQPSPMSDDEKKEWETEKGWMQNDATLEGKHEEKDPEKNKEAIDKEKTQEGTVKTSPEKESVEAGAPKETIKDQSTQDNFTENNFQEPEYSPLSEVTSETDLIKNLEAENLGNVFDPVAESSVIPPPSPEEIQSVIEDDIEDSISQQDGIDNAQFDEETFTQ